MIHFLLWYIISFSLCMFLNGCAYRFIKKPCTLNRLRCQMEQQLKEVALAHAFIGIQIQSLKTGEILYQKNAHKVMMPASNEKILTAAAALLNLSPDFQFKTQFFICGCISDSILNGDLIILGSGDPSIYCHFVEYDVDSCQLIVKLANILKNKGIKAIHGNLIGVDGIYDHLLVPEEWTLNNLSYSYATQLSGLLMNENSAHIKIEADSCLNKTYLHIIPNYDYIQVENNIQVVNNKKDITNIKAKRIEGGNNVVLSGNMFPRQICTKNLSLHHPTRFFLTVLRSELKNSGILISGKLVDNISHMDSSVFTHAQLIHTHHSDSLSVLLKTLMKKSNNLYAESLVKLLGAKFGKEGSFQEGKQVIKQTLKRFGLVQNGYVFNDGSGLGRYNYISPAQIVKILRGIYYHPYGRFFFDSLPVAGVDGTLDYRMKGTIAQYRVHAKTGTISNVRCLSGYIKTMDEEILAFSIMVNNYICDVDVVMDLQDRICLLLSSFKRS